MSRPTATARRACERILRQPITRIEDTSEPSVYLCYTASGMVQAVNIDLGKIVSPVAPVAGSWRRRRRKHS